MDELEPVRKSGKFAKGFLRVVAPDAQLISGCEGRLGVGLVVSARHDDFEWATVFNAVADHARRRQAGQGERAGVFLVQHGDVIGPLVAEKVGFRVGIGLL